MKKILFLSLILLTGCHTVKWVQRHCDEMALVCVTDRTVEVQYRDTTIVLTDTFKLELPTDSVTIRDTIEIINDKAYLKPIHREYDNIGVDVWVDASEMNVRAYYLDSVLAFPVTDTVFLEKVIKDTTIGETIRVKYVPIFYRVITTSFFLLLGMLVVYFLFMLKSGKS